jgi:anti-sigma regulatory factor (Ser/Thr protein kinase)
VPEARRFVAELLAGCPAREVLVTCASELCANAIVHTASGRDGVFTVEVELPRDGVARIAVTDGGGPSLPTARSLDPMSLDPMASDPMASDPMASDPMTLDLMAEGGRGLALVAASTSRWGYADAYPGRTVWAEACWPVPVASPGDPSSRQTSGRPRPWFSRPAPRTPDDLPPDSAA